MQTPRVTGVAGVAGVMGEPQFQWRTTPDPSTRIRQEPYRVNPDWGDSKTEDRNSTTTTTDNDAGNNKNQKTMMISKKGSNDNNNVNCFQYCYCWELALTT